MFINDFTYGIDMIMHCDKLIATPINLGTSEIVSVNELVDIIEEIGEVKLQRTYKLDAPKGVGGRNRDNTFIRSILDWEPSIPLTEGLKTTYARIEQQYTDRKAGKRTIQD